MSLSTTGGIVVNGGKEFVRHLADFQEAAAARVCATSRSAAV